MHGRQYGIFCHISYNMISFYRINLIWLNLEKQYYVAASNNDGTIAAVY